MADAAAPGSQADAGAQPSGGADASAAPTAPSAPQVDAGHRDPAIDARAPLGEPDPEGEPDAGNGGAVADAAVAWPPLEAEQIGPLTQLRAGFKLAESPVWHPCHDKLLFVDVDNSVIHAFDGSGALSTFRSDTNYTNGIGLDPEGRLVAAEMGGGKGGRIVRHNHDGSVEVLANADPQGRRLHTVDDVVVHRNGTIFFTDADFPHGPYDVNILTVTLIRLPLYILRSGANGLELTVGPSVRGPNGVELSPDQKTLYLSAYFEDQVLKYAVAEDGSLTPQGALATRLNKADSMCLDAAGNLYVGVETGLQVLRPDGTRVKFLRIASAHGTTNCTFGGPDGKTLFVTSYEALWKVENMPIPGLDWTHNREAECP